MEMKCLNLLKIVSIFIFLNSNFLRGIKSSTLPLEYPENELINITSSSYFSRNIVKDTNIGKIIVKVEDEIYIEELNSRLSDLKLKNDFKFSGCHLLRWIKYADYDLQHAEELLRNHILWRKSINIGKLLKDFKNHPVVNLSSFPYYFTGTSYENNPVIYIPIGKWKLSRMTTTVEDRKNIVKYGIFILEKSLEFTKGLTYSGQDVCQTIFIFDFDGYYVWNLREILNILIYFPVIFRQVLPNYPLLARALFFVRLPAPIQVFGSIITRMRNTFNRKEFVNVQYFDNIRTRSMEKALRALINPSAIPLSLGGRYNYKIPIQNNKNSNLIYYLN